LLSDQRMSRRSKNGVIKPVIRLGDDFAFGSRQGRLQTGLRPTTSRRRCQNEQGRRVKDRRTLGPASLDCTCLDAMLQSHSDRGKHLGNARLQALPPHRPRPRRIPSGRLGRVARPLLASRRNSRDGGPPGSGLRRRPGGPHHDSLAHVVADELLIRKG
jgi:hypothetical protein